MLHISIYIWSLFAMWKWSNWRRWRQYHSTLLFMPLANLVYSLLVNDPDFYLWKYTYSPFLSPELASFFYSVLVFPATVLLFLSNYPAHAGVKDELIHILKYIGIYIVFEWIGLEVGAIEHAHGWNLLWSTWFNLLTFSILRIHHTNPSAAYFLSSLITGYLLFHFHVPLWDSQ
ncbi:CBO0543 family protein [Paenibacillus hexagrammi]|uniref:Uncharacterized protein n=1 Tax=Paenibacillus hexagrammi TaxID=2908839 RepID=A0ABY3SLZ7_9BACL|nr:CBO0543 family protein [Paenibacillus sp. YPD9-1]UJF34877.1 hypothetical protein L0M14_06910 [Paenibacillus sp. YPD9-1]